VLYEQLRSRRRGSIDGLALPPGRSDVLCCSTGWPVAEASCADPSAVAAFERLQALVDAIRQVRAQHQVPPRRRITLHAAAETIHELSGFGPVLETLAGLGAVTSAPPPAASVVFMLEGAELHLSDLADALDHAAERERLEKLIESLTQSLAALDKRLANPGYTEKAPRHLVDETRAQRDRHATDLEGARRQLAGLA
jgi:valyl-tRNA synthetase